MMGLEFEPFRHLIFRLSWLVKIYVIPALWGANDRMIKYIVENIIQLHCTK